MKFLQKIIFLTGVMIGLSLSAYAQRDDPKKPPPKEKPPVVTPQPKNPPPKEDSRKPKKPEFAAAALSGVARAYES